MADPCIGVFLQAHIDGEHIIVARLALVAAQLADDAAIGIDLDLARARLAAQFGLEDLLGAVLADAEAR